MAVGRYALIKDGIVVNVILLDPESSYTPPNGFLCVPAGEGPSTADPRTRPPSAGDRTVKVRGARALTRPYDFEKAPDPEPVVPGPSLEDRIAALEAKLGGL